MYSCPVLLPTVGSLRQVSSHPVRTSYAVNAVRTLAPCRTTTQGVLQPPRTKHHQIAYTHTHTHTHTHTYIYIYIYIKVKFSRYRPGVAQRVVGGIALLFHDRGTIRGWVVSNMPRPQFTPGKDLTPILQEAGWASGSVWTGGKSILTGIRSRTIQPVVNRYTDWATPPPTHINIYIYIYIYEIEKKIVITGIQVL